MFTLISRALSYVWNVATFQQPYPGLVNKDFENISEMKADKYSLLLQDEDELKNCSNENKDIKQIRGTVTNLNTDQRYGLINREIYFSFDSIVGDKVVSVGDTVCAEVMKPRDKEDGWYAESVFVTNEFWQYNNYKELSSDDTNENINLSNEAAEMHNGDNFLVAMITEMSKGKGLLNNSIQFSLEECDIEFEPICGDWVTAKLVPSPSGDKVVQLKPQRTYKFNGTVTSINRNGGIVDYKVPFLNSACEDGYMPNTGHLVSVVAIENSNRNFNWRAMSIMKKKDLPKVISPSNGMTSPRCFLKDLLSSKEGVTVSDIPPVNLNFGEQKSFVITITNKSSTEYKLRKCKFHNFPNGVCDFMICSSRKEANNISNNANFLTLSKTNKEVLFSEEFILIPGKSRHLNVVCIPRSVGYFEHILLLEFDHFDIGRQICVKVEDIDEYVSQSFYGIVKHQKMRTSGCVIPGVKPRTNSKIKFPVNLPFYDIPDHLWTFMEENIDIPLVHIVPNLKEGLSMKNYEEWFSTLLYIEEIMQSMQMRQFDLAEVFLYPVGQYLALNVPGLAEGRPSLLIGDKILLTDPGDENSLFLFEGFVHEVLKNSVLLMFNSTFHSQYQGESYNASFQINRTQMRRFHYIVNQAESIGEEVLFPVNVQLKNRQVCLVDIPKSTILSKENEHTEEHSKSLTFYPFNSTRSIKWFNNNLNDYQRAAVCRILTGECRPTPYIVFGPPGTGKTVTIVEAILQVFTNIPSSRILICTPSNSAADLVVEKLIENCLLTKSDIVRLNAFQRSLENITESVKPFCQNGDCLHLIVRHRIIVSTCNSAGIFYSLGLRTDHFTHVFVDEAGQTIEPECLLAIGFAAMSDGQIVLSGDPLQLGPVIFSDPAKHYLLGTSFLERVMDFPIYQKDKEKFSDQGNYDPYFITKLVNNYRSHPAILKLPSGLFYDNELICSASVSKYERLCDWNLLPNRGFPVLFHSIKGEDLREGNSPSWFNSVEVVQVVKYLKELYNFGLTPSEIGIITPYVKQVEKIRLLINCFELDMCKVGSVEEFQGQERCAIIISTVRSRPKYTKFDKLHNLGFLSNPKRFNVAITRAQALLIVIGDADLLKKDPSWNAFIEYCKSNNSFLISNDDDDIDDKETAGTS